MEKKSAKQPTYSEAIAEIESILAGFNNSDMDIDKLAAQVRRAGELIAVCKERLRKAEQDVAKALSGDAEE